MFYIMISETEQSVLFMLPVDVYHDASILKGNVFHPLVNNNNNNTDE